jgi:hypothetical protein
MTPLQRPPSVLEWPARLCKLDRVDKSYRA